MGSRYPFEGSINAMQAMRENDRAIDRSVGCCVVLAFVAVDHKVRSLGGHVKT